MSEFSNAGGGPAGVPSLLDKVIRFCLENKLVVALMVIFFVCWGMAVAPFDWDLGGLPRSPVPTDAIPDIGENQQIIFTEWMGRSPQDVEDQITYPLTTSLLGIPYVRTVRSSSFFGFSSIYVIFTEEAEFYWSRSRVLEKLNSLPAGMLPEGVQPVLGPDSTALGQIYWYTIEGRDPDGNPTGGWDLAELRTVQDWYVRYSLLSAEGVSEVASVGGFLQEYQVDVDPDAMRAYDVTLGNVFNAVKMSNVDVGARTIEVNRAEYVIRGLGFIKSVSDVELAVVKVRDNVPIYVKNIGRVSLGPALRRGALDKGGAEAVGGVVVVRYGYNPLQAIKNVKAKIAEIEPLRKKAVFDFARTTQAEVEQFARDEGFEAFEGATPNRKAWTDWLAMNSRDRWPEWVTLSRLKIVPFYDRTGLIYETLGTLKSALSEEILVTIIVVLISVLHLRSSILISAALPLTVLICFIAMRTFGVDANIVALSGIAIAIGTIVDMSIIICENALRHLELAEPDEPRLEVVFRATREVGSAVLTAVATTVVSFLPVFAMSGAEGKLFKPLAFTKTFALVASVIVALTVVPPGAYLLFARRVGSKKLKTLSLCGLAMAGVILALWRGWWIAGPVLVSFSAYYLAADYLPPWVRKLGPWVASAISVSVVTVMLTRHWEPLGPERGLARNLIFVTTIIGGLLVFFHLFRHFYGTALRWCLAHKLLFLSLPLALLLCGAYAWLGVEPLLGPIDRIGAKADFTDADRQKLLDAGLVEERGEEVALASAALGMKEKAFKKTLSDLGVGQQERLFGRWELATLSRSTWKAPDFIEDEPLRTKVRWTLAKGWSGLGKEFMPPLDEGSFLYMPITMPHASIGEALDVLSKQDMAFSGIPEIESVAGKLGRADTPLDPAPISMIETVINYKPEYITGENGRRLRFRYDGRKAEFVRDEDGELIPDPKGRPYRQWRDEIKTPGDIWKEILKAGQLPGTTSASRLQPIAARIVMLQSGMHAPMGVKVQGPDLDSVERVGLEIERFLKEIPSIQASAVIADRIVGKPYLEIDPDRAALARYGIHERQVQDVIEVAIGGRRITTTVEGRERYPVRVRYLRELRDEIDTLGRILLPAPDGTQIPLDEVATIRYVRGPQAIKSEDTFLVGYVLFDMKPGHAEVDVVEECRQYLEQKIESGEFVLPAGVTYKFAGNYENQIRARKTMSVVLPLALFAIFMILYFQFKSISTTFLVFTGILVAWAGGFLLLWAYGQPWFLNFSVFGVGMRDLFQVHTVNLSIAVWVGFLALFGIASDNGVIIATYLDESFAERHVASIEDIREATVVGAVRRIRPCLMTSATTILALIPILTSTGRGADVMVPMAIPSFGGMLVVLISVFAVPVLYCGVAELKMRVAQLGGGDSPPDEPVE